MRRALLKQARQEIAAGVNRLDCIADGMLDKAIQDVSAASFVRDTLDGRPGPADNGDSNVGGVSIEIGILGNCQVNVVK